MILSSLCLIKVEHIINCLIIIILLIIAVTAMVVAIVIIMKTLWRIVRILTIKIQIIMEIINWEKIANIATMKENKVCLVMAVELVLIVRLVCKAGNLIEVGGNHKVQKVRLKKCINNSLEIWIIIIYHIKIVWIVIAFNKLAWKTSNNKHKTLKKIENIH